ncbi:MAG: GNAT family N-acetyltransferase [Clostridium sp.]|uniref:GNAT family N-acetyltransferase n=1 Tax=Clostridium sp. TaxID=1506 RepID=UPI002FC73253
MVSLETERLLLRPFREEDYLDLYEYAKTDLVGPRAGWMPHKSVEESKEIVKMLMVDGSFAVVLKSENKLIGSIAVHNRVPKGVIKEDGQMEVGYCLNPSYWGKGYMPEAVKEIIRYSFIELRLNILWIAHTIDNTNSQRVIEKSGFNYRFTGEDVFIRLNNKKVINKCYSITREEYLNFM